VVAISEVLIVGRKVRIRQMVSSRQNDLSAFASISYNWKFRKLKSAVSNYFELSNPSGHFEKISERRITP
jgi:hypothetical protein